MENKDLLRVVRSTRNTISRIEHSACFNMPYTPPSLADMREKYNLIEFL